MCSQTWERIQPMLANPSHSRAELDMVALRTEKYDLSSQLSDENTIYPS